VHLALPVGDVVASIAFYGAHFGFREWYRADDAVLLTDDRGNTLALTPGEPVRDVTGFFHFGFDVASPEEVRAFHDRMVAARVELAEPLVEEEAYVAFKCLDPDGYRIEVGWEPRPGNEPSSG
jgi:catechol 2,3-dioxygenase-like lactoylglutathione lyase family enzyme